MKTKRALCSLLALVGVGLIAVPSMAWHSDGKSAEALLKEIDALKPPDYDETKQADQKYNADYSKKYQEYRQKRNDMVFSFYRSYPKHERATPLIQGWMKQLAGPDDPAKCDEAVKKLDALSALKPDEAIAKDAAYYRFQYQLYKPLGRLVYSDAEVDETTRKVELEKALSLIADYNRAAPTDERVVRWYGQFATASMDPTIARSLYEKAITKFPTASYTGYYKGKIRQMDGLGQPFELSFKDATTGQAVSMESLRGKVVMIDFWATWCGPCVAEMPEVKKLYAEYHDKGFEIIGVSLDQPEALQGLEKLKKYVKDNGIAWPQYYQGNFWESEFSKGWGINAIPSMFLVDKQGRLRYVDARGDKEGKVKELLGEN